MLVELFLEHRDMFAFLLKQATVHDIPNICGGKVNPERRRETGASPNKVRFPCAFV